MSNIYIEHNKTTKEYEAKTAGNSTPIATGLTQKEVEDKVKILFPHVKPDVERVKHTEKGVPGEWRKE